jgi:hypothetical protein
MARKWFGHQKVDRAIGESKAIKDTKAMFRKSLGPVN